MYFETNEDRATFLEGTRRRKAATGARALPDGTPKTYYVSSRHRRQYSAVMYLIYTDEGYVPMTFDVVVVNDRPKIRPLVPSSRVSKMTVTEAAIDALKKKLRSWQNAQGDTLKEQVTDLKERLRDEIAAISMAKNKSLKLVSGYGTVEERQQLLDRFGPLSDAEIKTLMIKEAEATLARLARQSQPS